jgi:pimeloyl-ACP methyl ester carboxylesterase
MPNITLRDGRTLHYEDVGAGAPLLLLHGFPLSSQSFWPQLAAPPEGVRLLVPDHRGFGSSSLGAGSSTMEALADDALALLDALGLPNAFVGGVSMGGYVAIALARLDPGRVRGLVLIDTQSTGDDEAGRARREATARDVELRGAAAVAEPMLPKLLAKAAPAELVARVDALMRAQAPQAIAAAARGMASRVDGKDILSRYQGPCLVVVGAEDAITPLEKAQVMVDLVRGAKLVVLDRAGHLANLEQPTAFAKALSDFVREAQGY